MLWKRKPKPSITDPVFGEMTRERYGWKGTIPSPLGTGDLWVIVEGTDDAPEEVDRTVFSAFLRNYPSLVPALKEALFQLWYPDLDETDWDETCPTTPDALWNMLQLDCVTINLDHTVELLYGFEGDFWPDGMFSVRVDDMAVKPLSLDD